MNLATKRFFMYFLIDMFRQNRKRWGILVMEGFGPPHSPIHTMSAAGDRLRPSCHTCRHRSVDDGVQDDLHCAHPRAPAACGGDAAGGAGGGVAGNQAADGRFRGKAADPPPRTCCR